MSSAAQVVTLYGPDGRPAPRASSLARPPSAALGRRVRRKAAGQVGTLVNWTLNYVSARLAEMERRKASDRALDLYVNSSIAHGILEGLVTDVVGTGLTPQPQPLLDWLDLDAEWAAEWTRKAYGWFELCGLDPRHWADAQRRHTIYGLQGLALFLWKLEGAAFTQVITQERSGAPCSVRLLPICPSRVRTPMDRGASDRVFDGVEIDDYGAPVAIWVAPAADTSAGAYRVSFQSNGMQRLPVWDEATGLPKVLITTRVRNVAEYREDGILTAILKDIRDGEDLREAASIKALISNTFALFVAEEPGIPGADSAGTSVPDWADRVQELERGMIIQGQPWQKPTEIKTDAPGPNYEIMVKDIMTGLGIATGRGRENIVRQYEASYSASQASMENEAKWSDQDRQVLADTHCQPWWMWLCLEGVLRGRLPVDSVEAFRRDLYAYTRTSWMRPPARYIDKQKIANADDTRLKNRTATLSAIWAEKGEDWRTAVRQSLTEEQFIRAERKRLGLPDPDVVDALKKAAGRGNPDGDGDGQ